MSNREERVKINMFLEIVTI